MSFAYQDAFYFLGVSLTFIVAFLLFRSPVAHRATNRLLGITFFSMGWYNMIFLLTITGVYTKVYWLAGWGPSLGFLIAPCAYLYVRQTLSQKEGIRRRDWIHFLPFAIVFIDMIPFNVGLTHVDKATYVANAVRNYNEFYLQKISLIPLPVLFFLRPALSIVYLVFQWRIVIPAARRKLGRLYHWLLTLTSIQTVFYLAMTTLTVLGSRNGVGIYVVLKYQGLLYLLFALLISISIILLLYPDALYGLKEGWNPGSLRLGPKPLPVEKAVVEPKPVNERMIAQYLPIIEAYMQKEKPYLQSKWSIQDMAVATSIPLHNLSYIINQHYKMRYTDLMNQYRVEHAKALISGGAWKELSLEGLGKQSGFSNRTNFFLVFKKSTGLSPSEYLNQEKGLKLPGI
jgi:AraC-like DNA-binding protein